MNPKARLFSIFVLLLSLLSVLRVHAQDGSEDSLRAVIKSAPDDTNKVHSLIELSSYYYGIDPNVSIKEAETAKQLSKKLNFLRGLALSSKSVGIGHYFKSDYVEALQEWQFALSIFDSIGDESGVANMLSNIGGIYFNQGNESEALDYYLRALKIAEKLNDSLRIATACINIGALYNAKSATYDKALEYYQRALPISEKLGDKDAIGLVSVNIGELYMTFNKDSIALQYFIRSKEALKGSENLPYTLNNIGNLYRKKGEFNRALNYHNQAYKLADSLEAKLDMVQSLVGLASTYQASGNFKQSVTTNTQAETLAKEIRANYELKNIYEGLSRSYYELSDFKNAYRYSNLMTAIKDTIYNIETDQKLSALLFNFEIEKKESQIDILTKDKKLQEVEIQRQKLVKNAFLAGLILILVIAFILYRSYQHKVQTNKILDEQKHQIEGLLLNILPQKVAKELQEEGRATPRYYDSVSVLFTDFKGFTTLSHNMTPNELVEELNTFFVGFDRIIQKHNIEKIKTIGDAYMCAGGIPVANTVHPVNIIEAGLEIQEFMRQRNLEKLNSGLPVWELRIGIHTGPVVAGVVGLNKYAYDIWGSTVNIASRMESSGEAGKVNISESTYLLVKDSFNCIHRGKITAKNAGDLNMYFVDHAHTVELS